MFYAGDGLTYRQKRLGGEITHVNLLPFTFVILESFMLQMDWLQTDVWKGDNFFQFLLHFTFTAGMYCAGHGLAVPTGTCAAGWYCSGGAYSDKPTTYVNSSSSIDCPIYSLNETGGVCLPGKDD